MLRGLNINATHLSPQQIVEQAVRCERLGGDHLRWECLCGGWHCGFSEYDPPDDSFLQSTIDYNLTLYRLVRPDLVRLGLKVVWDLHWYPGMPRDMSGQCGGVAEARSMFKYEKNLEALERIWAAYTQSLKGDSVIHSFDLVNEPNYLRGEGPKFGRWARGLISKIKKVDGSRICWVSPKYGEPDGVSGLGPFGKHLTIHCYLWREGRVGGVREWMRILKPVRELADKKRWQVYVGEFGADPVLTPGISARQRQDYYTDLITLFRRWGWGYAVWESQYGIVGSL